MHGYGQFGILMLIGLSFKPKQEAFVLLIGLEGVEGVVLLTKEAISKGGAGIAGTGVCVH